MKHVSYISRKKLDQFSQHDLDFIFHQEKLEEFIGLPFSLENFNAQIRLKDKNYKIEKREALSHVLSENYNNLSNNGISLNQIKKLENTSTYTITTGHQLCLLGGPMYFFLKIIHVIKLSEVLNKQFPDKHFIPIFWMASEDHDSDEIDHINLFNKTFRWEHQQSGPVGRFQNKNIKLIFEELLGLFKDNNTQEIREVFDTFTGQTYGQSFLNWLHHLFGEKGLIIVDGDQKKLKELFKPIIKAELSQNFSNNRIQITNKRLKELDRKIQVHSREINLFYLEGNNRTRIIKDENKFKIGQKAYDLDDLLKNLSDAPEQFSPNAVLRPLYQECILPNLCYVGGMAEMNYWAQLKGVFEEAQITYPLLQLRSNLLWIDGGISKKMKTSGLFLDDLFKSTAEIKNQLLTQNDSQPIDENEIKQGLEAIEHAFKASITNKQGLNQWLGSELNTIKKSITQINNKIQKEKKKSFDIELIRIEKIKEALFPNNQLQERHQNLLHFCNQNSYKQILNDLHLAIDPLKNDFTIITEENESK